MQSVLPEQYLKNPQATPSEPAGGLKQGVLSPLETLAQSIAGIAPSATPGMLIPIVFGFAGNGAWLSYVLATVGLLFTAKCINEFASRSSGCGSVYTFVTTGSGAQAGMLTGCAMLFAYIFCGAVCVTEFAVYGMALAHQFLHLETNSAVMMLGAAAVIALVACKDIRLSATLMFWLEFISISLILAVVALTLIRPSAGLDMAQLTLSGVKFENVRMGLVMAIFSFVAFESAASLGTEAATPLVSIPRAIMRSVLFSGAFFVVTAYAMVSSFNGSAIPLDKCSTPMLAMATRVGFPSLGHLIDVGVMMGFFAAAIANLNGAARMMYKMSQDGVFHIALASAHHKNGTPHVAIVASSVLSLSIALVLSGFGCPLMDIVGWLGTLATFGFMFAYVATSIASANMLRSLGRLGIVKTITVIASIAVLLFATFGSIFPAPPFPYNVLPFTFAAYMVMAWIWCRTIRKVKPEAQ